MDTLTQGGSRARQPSLPVRVGDGKDQHPVGLPLSSVEIRWGGLHATDGWVVAGTPSAIANPDSSSVEVANFTLGPVNATSTKVAGHGHLHLIVDGNLTQMVVAVTSFTVADLAVGTHTVRVTLAHNDHTAIPGENTSFEVTVTVREPQAPPRGFLPGFGAFDVLSAAGAAVIALGLGRARRKA